MVLPRQCIANKAVGYGVAKNTSKEQIIQKIIVEMFMLYRWPKKLAHVFVRLNE